MAFTYRDYVVWEAALSVETLAPTAAGHERIQEGDILAIRQESDGIGGVGQKEMLGFVWLRLEGLESTFMAELETGMIDALDEAVRWDKRRFCIPLARLAQVFPAFDVVQARDRTRCYQPFLSVDEESGLYTSKVQVLSVFGLVFDKQRMKYL